MTEYIQGYCAAIKAMHAELAMLNAQAAKEHWDAKLIFGLFASGKHHEALGKSDAVVKMGSALLRLQENILTPKP